MVGSSGVVGVPGVGRGSTPLIVGESVGDALGKRLTVGNPGEGAEGTFGVGKGSIPSIVGESVGDPVGKRLAVGTKDGDAVGGLVGALVGGSVTAGMEVVGAAVKLTGADGVGAGDGCGVIVGDGVIVGAGETVGEFVKLPVTKVKRSSSMTDDLRYFISNLNQNNKKTKPSETYKPV